MALTARHIRSRTLPMLPVLAVLVLAPDAASAQVGEIPPVDEAARDPGFFLFRARLMTALAERDLELVDHVLSDSVKSSFGGDGGRAEFHERWKTDAPDSELWSTLIEVLALGGELMTWEDGVEGFAAPYVFSADLGQLDAFRAAAVLGEGVRVRSRPSLDGEVLTLLSFVWVEVPDWRPVDDAEGAERTWIGVKLADGRSGYVADDYLRSPIDYRALFAYREGRWHLEALVAGD